MNRIIEYFENLENKYLIMIVISIILVSIMIGYYFNGLFQQQKEEIINKKIQIEKKLKKVINLEDKLVKERRKNKLLKTRFNNLRNDLKFLLSEIESSKILFIDNEKFLSILHKYIDSGSKINASFEINNNNSLNKYNIKINGIFDVEDFFIFTDFLKILQDCSAIVSIDNLIAIEKNNLINYDINVTIWSFR